MSTLIDTYLGPYRLVEVIGRGSTSTVYKAYQRSLNRHVAIKVLLPSLDPQFTARFEREAQLVAQLQHPNILPIYDYGEQDKQSYFVMQYIPNGTTLAHLMTGKPMETAAALRMMIPTLEGLGYAHSHGVIHRDIKPSNILLPSTIWPMLADWGIAKVTYDDRHLTPPGQTVGTAVYMAPERANGQRADARSDIYAIGIVLYELLTGRVPFDGPTPMTVLGKHISQSPAPPRSINPLLSPALEAILLRALEKNPADRFQHAEELATALQQLVIDLGPALPATPATPSTMPTTIKTGYETGKLSSISAPAGALPATPVSTPAPRTPIPAIKRGLGRVFASRVAALVLILALLVASFAVLLSLLPDVVARTTTSTAIAPAATGQPVAGITTNTVTTVTTESVTFAGSSTGTLTATTMPTPVASTPTTLPTTVPAIVIDFPTATAVQPTETLAPPTAAPAPPVVVITPLPPVPSAIPVPTPVPTTVPVAIVPPKPAGTVPPGASPLPAGIITGRIEDTEWRGGYVRPGHAPFKGRTATWVYAASTQYHTMATTILLPLAGQPKGTASLLIEGMDSEGPAKTLISISVNGQEIYNGPDPLPDDIGGSPQGNWGSYTWTFSAGLIHNGPNTITISNLSPGQFGLPPWFMLDYADLSFVAP